MAEIDLKLTVDNSQLLSKLKTSGDAVAGFTRKFTQEAEREKGLIEDLTDAIEELEEAKKKAFTTEELTKYNRKIAEAKNDLKQYNEQGLKPVEQQNSRLMDSFKRVGAAMLAAFSVGAVINFAKEAFKAYEMQTKAERQLLTALKGRKDAQQALIQQASALQRSTGISDTDIIAVQKLAATYGLSTKQIKQVTEASLELASATGQDLNAASMQLLGTFEGNIGRLGKLDDAFKKLTPTQLENGAAVDIIIAKYGGLSRASNTASASLSVAWDEMLEKIGKSTGVVSKGIQFVTSIIDGFSKTASESLTESFETRSMTDLLKLSSDLNKQLSKTVTLEGRDEYKAFLLERINLVTIEINARRKQDREDAKATADRIKRKAEENARLKTMSLDELQIELQRAQAAEENTTAIQKRIQVLQKEQAEAEKNKQAFEAARKAVSDFVQEGIKAGIDIETDPLVQAVKARELAINQLKKSFEALRKSATPAELSAINEAFALQVEKINKSFDTLLPQPEQFKVQADQINTTLRGVGRTVEDVTKGIEDAALIDSSIWDLLGIPEEDFNKAAKYFTMLAESLSTFNQIAISNAEQQTAAYDEQLQAAQQALEDKQVLADEGVVIDVTAEKNKIAQIEAARAGALEEEKKLKRQQLVLDSVSQLSNLITASAELWQTSAVFGPVAGPILAIGAIATMFASFIAAKAQAAKEINQFAEGGKVKGERLQGRSHSQGGIPIEAEGGEWIINRESSGKYDGLLAGINEDNKHKIMLELNKLNPNISLLNKISKTVTSPQFPVERLIAIENELKDLNRFHRSKADIVATGNKVITIKGNQTKIIHG